MREIEIGKVLGLSRAKKYEITCASFDLVDHIFKVEVPRSLKQRKLAVQAISLLSDGHIQYGYDQHGYNAPEGAESDSEAETPASSEEE